MDATSSPAGMVSPRPDETASAERVPDPPNTPPELNVHADQHKNAVPAVSRMSEDNQTVSTLEALTPPTAATHVVCTRVAVAAMLPVPDPPGDPVCSWIHR